MSEDDVEITVVQDGLNEYAEYEPFERVMEVVFERGDRRVEYVYELEYTDDVAAELNLHVQYYRESELLNTSRNAESFSVDDGLIEGIEIEQFAIINALVDPQVVLEDEFESMVDAAA